MGLTIRFQGGERAGQVVRFDDDVETVLIGRNPDTCQIVFPPDETKVGREHCTLRRVAGRYRLQVSKDHLVLLDGQTAMDDQELGESADVQLGPEGPRLVVETTAEGGSVPLPATAEQGERPGRVTLIRGAAQTARRGRRLAALALGLLVVAAGVGYLALRAEARKRQRMFVQVTERTTVIQDLVDRMDEKFVDFGARLGRTQEEVEAACRKAKPSVYLVLLRFGEDEEIAHGTAWVVRKGTAAEPGLLATNAHVAAIFTDVGKPVDGLERYGPLKALAVRSVGGSHTFSVTDARIHPGYHAFETIWNEYLPGYGRTLDKLQVVEAPGSACDVALLSVRDAGGLADPLPIASPETCAALREGNPVGFVGYPMESLSLAQLRCPTPTVQADGRITAVTDHLGVEVTDAAGHKLGHLIQHSLPMTGGASGSPLLNCDGEVVGIVSAMNVVGIAGGRRAPSAAGVNFAQRADLLTELTDPADLDRIQAGRNARWRAQMGRVFDSCAAVVRQEVLPNLRTAWEAQLARETGGRGASTIRQVACLTGPLQRAAPEDPQPTATLKTTVPDAGRCLVVAISTGTTPIGAAVSQTSGPNRGQRSPGRQVFPQFPWVKMTEFLVGGRTDIEVSLAGTDPGTVIEVFVFQAVKRAIPVHQRMAAAWQRHLKDSLKQDVRAAVIDQKADQVFPAPPGPGQTVEIQTQADLPAAGHYFAVAVAEGEEDIKLSVVRTKSGRQVVLGKDDARDHHPCVAFQVDEKAAVDVHVYGRKAGTRFAFFLYRAVPASGV